MGTFSNHEDECPRGPTPRPSYTMIASFVQDRGPASSNGIAPDVTSQREVTRPQTVRSIQFMRSLTAYMRSSFFVLCLSVTAFAQERPIAIKAARLFDGVADRLTTPGFLVVQGGRIAQTGGSAPQDAQVID